MQEVQIANFLYLNGIEYEYEKEYPYPIPNARKKYTPDFYIYQGENEAYIEHYGISQDYKNSSFSDIQIEQYKNNVKDKQKMHSLRKTKLITTWSKYNDGKTLLEHLEEGLQKNGFIFKSRDPKEVYDKIIKTGKDKYVIKFILFMREFIERYKTLGYDLNGFNILRKKTTNQRNLLFLDLAEKVYNHYQDTLRAQNKIDFADMLNEGKLYLDEIERQGGKLNYKYIIIDEFQDVARQRFNFTKRLSDIANAKVVAVGDDWQSIYAFAGSDITLFTRFIELMGGDGKELKITHTYRNSQELIDIAGNFVQKNTSQIRKRLISPKHLEQPIVVDAFEDTYPIFTNLAICIEDMIGEIIDEFGSKSKILLIGRYNFDLYKILNTKKFNVTGNEKLKSQKYPQADLTFMTAHKSKGLGYDNVILINMFEGKFGFPSQIEEDPIMKLVTHEDTAIPFAEERRLLYVALTRTKNRVYIAAPMNRPSRFLIELINDYRLEHPEEMNMKVRNLFQLRCPKCGFPLKNDYNKNYGLQLFICTNEPEVCSFMTNSKECMRDIHLCPECGDGYMIVNKNKNDSTFFFGCTNYDTDKKCQCKERIDK
jgi:DNA helicase-4